jgi:phosphonate transport system permease protein
MSATSDKWKLRQPFGARTLLALLVASMVLAVSAYHIQIPRIFTSPIGKGLARFGSQAFPMVIAEVTPLSRRPDLDRSHLPLLSHIETREKKESRFDFAQNKMVETTETEEVLVEPVGYVVYVCVKMLESIELALWGTIFAIIIGLPLACLGARGYSPTRAVYLASRFVSSLLRAVPELVSALVLTLAFGFGPMAGVVALAFHSAGFFGKFFADDIENADRAPQDALLAAGANRLKVLRRAVLPLHAVHPRAQRPHGDGDRRRRRGRHRHRAQRALRHVRLRPRLDDRLRDPGDGLAARAAVAAPEAPGDQSAVSV